PRIIQSFQPHTAKTRGFLILSGVLHFFHARASLTKLKILEESSNLFRHLHFFHDGSCRVAKNCPAVETGRCRCHDSTPILYSASLFVTCPAGKKFRNNRIWKIKYRFWKRCTLLCDSIGWFWPASRAGYQVSSSLPYVRPTA